MIKRFSTRILSWFDAHGRKDLPWQLPVTPYGVWVSEVMLQQTQVKTVIPYFLNFMEQFPNVIVLAKAHEDDVMSAWAGLGYYSRARNLHRTSQIINEKYNGIFPSDYSHVIALPGIGRSTAGAILSLSMNQPYAILDGNVKRVLSRHQLIEGQPNTAKTLKAQWYVAESLMPEKRFGDYSQAMMDIGAIICTRTKPNCICCPIKTDCLAKKEGKINEFPHKKKKKLKPLKQAYMIVVTDGHSVLLEKRSQKGIWGGLWSFPEVEKQPQNYALFTDDSIRKIEEWEMMTHVFTHYRLEIFPIIIRVKKLSNGFDEKQIKKKGIPKPVTGLITQLNLSC